MNLIEKPLFLLFLLLPFFPPGVIAHLPLPLNDFFNLWRVLSFVIIAILFFRYGKLDGFLVALVAFLFVIFISTLLNSGNLFSFSVSAGALLGTCILINLSLSTKSYMIIKVMFHYLGLLVVVNLALIFVFDGNIPIQHVYHVYFFGHRNSITPVAILLLTICAIYYHIQKKRLSLWMLIVVTSTILGMLFIWSATGVAVMFIFVLLILFINNGVLFKFMNFAAFAPITIGSFFFVVVFRLQEHISFLIEQILDRSLTFTGRTIIWDFSIMMISQAPFLGYGVRQSSDPTWLGWSSTYLWFSHNGVLEILLRGGFIGLITYIVLVVYVIVSLLKHRANPIAALLSAGIFAFFISMLMESSFKSVYLFATFAFAFYVDKIIETTEEAPLVEELQESKYIISKMHNKSIYIR